MQLRTLGRLELAESSFARIKPLVLVSYLALEGPQDRRYAAEFFWPEAADPLNSLSRALSQLRKGTSGTVEADDQRVWSSVGCDVRDFEAALESEDLESALDLHQGPFLDGVRLDWGLELEEWVYATRERLAGRAQDAHLRLAEQEAGRGRFAEASRRTETAYRLKGAPVPEPETLMRYHALLSAGESPLAAEVRNEAAGYGIELSLKPDEARARLRTSFIGRERDLDRLRALEPGHWAWLRGAASMGKTTLMRALEGTYLPGRSGLPYATLEPLLGEALEEGEDLILRHLGGARGTWLVDGWEWMDQESQELLKRLRDLRPQVRVVIASRQESPLRVDLETDLGLLSADELTSLPSAFEKTGGLPALVGALLRDEPLEAALEVRLHALPESAANVYLALSLMERPDPGLVRRSLKLEASVMAQALELLTRAGLIDAAGGPPGRRGRPGGSRSTTGSGQPTGVGPGQAARWGSRLPSLSAVAAAVGG